MQTIKIPNSTGWFEFDEVRNCAYFKSYGSTRIATETELALIKMAVGGGGLPPPPPPPVAQPLTASPASKPPAIRVDLSKTQPVSDESSPER